MCGLKLAVIDVFIVPERSHPTWVCGLKLQRQRKEVFFNQVTPYVGVWIETNFYYDTLEGHRVTPYVGVWIETDIV